VYSDPLGTVNGYYLGATSNTSVQVLGPYASSDIPDPWFTQYFGPAPNSQAAPTVDADGVGFSNLQKYQAGFNPTNPAAYLHVISVAKANGTNVVVTFLGADGDSTYPGGPTSRTNVLEYTTPAANGGYVSNFTNPPVGSVVLNAANGLGTVTNMTDFGGAANSPSRYYRVRVLLP